MRSLRLASGCRSPWLVAILVAGGLAASVVDLEGQRRRRGFGGDLAAYQQLNTPYTGLFTFVRLYYRSGGWGNPGWAHDWPVAERNFGRIMDELTSLEPYLGGSNVLAMDDPELFKYPVAYLSEPGYWTMTAEEAESLREYLLKGGFLILDDNRGPEEWYNTRRALEYVLPDHRLVQLDASHPIFDSFFRIENLAMPHPNFRGFVASYWGIYEENDPEGRLLVIVNRDNDIGDYWEWSDRGFVPIEFSNEAYKLGVNYVIYALTH